MFTPDAGQVRDAYVRRMHTVAPYVSDATHRDEFDRWLGTVRDTAATMAAARLREQVASQERTIEMLHADRREALRQRDEADRRQTPTVKELKQRVTELTQDFQRVALERDRAKDSWNKEGDRADHLAATLADAEVQRDAALRALAEILPVVQDIDDGTIRGGSDAEILRAGIARLRKERDRARGSAAALASLAAKSERLRKERDDWKRRAKAQVERDRLAADLDNVTAAADQATAQRDHWMTRAAKAEEEVRRLRSTWPTATAVVIGGSPERVADLEARLKTIQGQRDRWKAAYDREVAHHHNHKEKS